MKIINFIKSILGKKTNINNYDDVTYESAIKSLKSMARDTDDLKQVLKDFENGLITEQKFVAICVVRLTKELAEKRKNESNLEAMVW
ncbi:hypothetical protein ACI1BE_000486 [Cronobacter turicensis]